MNNNNLYSDKRNKQDSYIAVIVVALFIGFYFFLKSNKNIKTLSPKVEVINNPQKVTPIFTEEESNIEESNEEQKTPPIPVPNDQNIYDDNSTLVAAAAPQKKYRRPTLLTLGSIKLKNNSTQELETNLKGLAQLIHFQSGTDIIKKESKPAVDAIATLLKNHPKVDIEVQSHTNNTQPEQELERVTNLRALKIQKELIERGVTSNLTAKGYGSKQPIVSNKTSQGRYLNRRIEFVITNK